MSTEDIEVVTDPSIPPGTCYIGALGLGTRIWPAQELVLEHHDMTVTYETTEADRQANMIRIRATERVRVRVKRPDGDCAAPANPPGAPS